MSRIGQRAVAVAMAVLLLAACSSSSKKASSSSSVAGTSGGKPTITVGVLTDLTGPGSNTSQFTPDGVKAGVALAASEGYNIKYVIADSATNPAAALSAAKLLVQEDHVFAIIAESAVLFAASSYLASAGVPVIGGDYDGAEWLTTPSMFSTFPYEDFTKVGTIIGQVAKLLGGTDVATLGYSISPSSADTAKAYALSARDAGLKIGYENSNVPFGTTNVGPYVLAMKSAGVDTVFPVMDTNTDLALIVGLRQQGVPLKAPFIVEEEGDLLAGGPASIAQSKDTYSLVLYEPPQVNSAATKEIAHWLQVGAGVTTPPTLNEYIAYLAIDAMVDGLKKAGPNATRAQFIQAMEGITDYTGRGLLASPISFAPTGRGDTEPCTYVIEWTGTAFHIVPKAAPICGTLTGQKV